MALLGENENTNRSPAETAGIDPVILNSLQSKVGANPINSTDFSSEETPVTGPLGLHDYFPGANQPINVGNYSGSEVGSLSLFAPSGQLVPFGLMDARDAAIRKAALQKQLDQDNFVKQHTAPTTKHVAVQPELTNQYYSFLNQSIDRAKKRYGKNWVGALNQDTDFNRANKNFQDLSKFHDAIVEHSAQLDVMEKDPNFVLSPEARAAQNGLLSGIAYKGENPFSAEAQDIGKKFFTAKALADLDVVTNKAIDKAIPDTALEKVKFQQRGTHELSTEIETELFSEDSKKQLAHDIYMGNFQGTGVSEEQVRKNLDAKLGEKVKRKVSSYQNMFPPDHSQDDYTGATPQVGKTFNFTSLQKDAKGNMLTVSVPVEHAYNLQANDSRKPISLPISDKMHDVNGTPINVKSGNVQGNVSGFGVAPYDNAKGRYLSQEEIANEKANGTFYERPGLNFKPVAFLNVSKSESDEQENIIPTGQTITVPLQDIKGKYKSKGIDDKIDEVEAKSTELNGVTEKAQYERMKKSGAGNSKPKKDPLGLFN